jgi:hypothetical protein
LESSQTLLHVLKKEVGKDKVPAVQSNLKREAELQ